MVLRETEGLKRAERIRSGLSESSSWVPPWQVKGRSLSSVNKVFKLIGETSLRKYNWSRRCRVGILAMAPLSLEETPRKKHISHPGTFSFQLLEN